MKNLVALEHPATNSQDSSGSASADISWWKWRKTLLYLFVSLLAVIPCLWQPYIHSVDLPSHTYNAWLTSVLEREPVQGIILESVRTNVLFDNILSLVAHGTGFQTAEIIVVAGCVLAFFWGVFGLIWRLNQHPAWGCIPLILAVSYGYIFRFGFLNFYLASGLSALAVAVWGRKSWRVGTAILLLSLGAVGNPMPPAYVASCALYWLVMKRFPKDLQIPMLFGCAVWLGAIGRVVTRLMPAAWSPEQVIGGNAPLQFFGFDQLWVYGSDYRVLAWMSFFISIAAVLTRIRYMNTFLRRPLVHCFVLNAVVIAMYPYAIQVSESAAPISFIPERISLFSCIILCVFIGRLPNLHWAQASFGAVALLFFVLTFTHDEQLSAFSRKLQTAVGAVPERSRVLALITTPNVRLNPFGHAVDRACMGHCFSFANYEPASKHFRVKALADNPIVLASPAEIAQLERGQYTVKPTDIPVYGICGCEMPSRICAVKMNVGERLCELRLDVEGAYEK